MLEKIKAKIIRLLGGHTEKEFINILPAKYYAGKSMAYLEMLSEMWRNYGKTADEWCKYIYEFAQTQHLDNNSKANEYYFRHENIWTSTEPRTDGSFKGTGR